MKSQKDIVDSVEFYFKPPRKLNKNHIKYLKENDQESLDFIESIDGLPCTEKAEVYLKKYLKRLRNTIEDIRPFFHIPDLEILSYFASRNIECGREIEIVVQYLRDAQAKELYYTGKIFKNDGGKTIEETEKLKPLSSPLENFWRSNEVGSNKYSDDAYYLRFIDWCKIDDFKDIWITRLKKEYEQLRKDEMINTDLLKLLLFDLCRSDYAISLLKPILLHLLEILESEYFTEDGEMISNENKLIDVQEIAVIVFSNIRLRVVKPKLLQECLTFITNNQNKDGGWSDYIYKNNSELLTTVIVIHSLVVAQEPYRSRMLSPCLDYIKTEQNVFGCWYSKEIHNIPLLVTILDALELAKGSAKVTFTIDKLLVSDTTKIQINTKVEKIKRNLLRWDGAKWFIRFNEIEKYVDNTKGMHIIAYLIKMQGTRIRADVIYQDIISIIISKSKIQSEMHQEKLLEEENLSTDFGKKEEMFVVDEDSVTEINNARKKIEEKLNIAELERDIPKINIYAIQIKDLEKWLSQNTDKFGKPRQIINILDKARKALFAVVKTAKKNIKKYHSDSLYNHLDDYLKTGEYPIYHPKTPIDWEVIT